MEHIVPFSIAGNGIQEIAVGSDTVTQLEVVTNRTLIAFQDRVQSAVEAGKRRDNADFWFVAFSTQRLEVGIAERLGTFYLFNNDAANVAFGHVRLLTKR